MTPSNRSPLTISPCADVADFFNRADRACGEPTAYLVDEPWVAAGFSRIDVFQCYSDHSGRPVEVRDLGLFMPGFALAIYAVPERNMPGFTSWLDDAAFPLRDGSFVCPLRFPPGSAPAPAAANPTAAAVLRRCHLIAAVPLPADHPNAMLLRMRNRSALAAGRVW